MAISLTVSSIDTLINSVSSLIIVDGNKVFKGRKDYLKFSKQIIIILSIIAFVVASKGLSILYLFLLADLLCCAAVMSIFYGFYNKKFSEKKAYVSISGFHGSGSRFCLEVTNEQHGTECGGRFPDS